MWSFPPIQEIQNLAAKEPLPTSEVQGIRKDHISTSSSPRQSTFISTKADVGNFATLIVSNVGKEGVESPSAISVKARITKLKVSRNSHRS